MTLLQKLDRLPPWLCRLMAKGPDGRLMSDAELGRRTGWTKHRVRRVSHAASFRDTTIAEVDTFLHACGMKWSQQRILLFLVKRALTRGGIESMHHLRNTKRYGSNGTQVSMILRHQQRIAKLLSK